MAIVDNTLQWIRKKFVEETGRFDLVEDLTDYEDKGADYFINSGNKILDMMIVDHPKTIQRFPKNLSAGDYKLEMKRLRSVELVEVMNADGRSEVTLVDYSYFRKTYNTPPSEVENGTPKECALLVNTLSPELKALTAVGETPQLTDYTNYFTYDSEGIRFYNQTPFLYDGIIFSPPSDGTHTMIVHGYFFSHLDEDSDSNYYSVNHPTLLVLAAKLSLYASYDNRAGIQDVLAAMDLTMSGIDRDLIRQQMARAGTVRKGL